MVAGGWTMLQCLVVNRFSLRTCVVTGIRSWGNGADVEPMWVSFRRDLLLVLPMSHVSLESCRK